MEARMMGLAPLGCCRVYFSKYTRPWKRQPGGFGIPTDRSAGFARQKGIEPALPDGVVDDIGLAVEHHLGAGDPALEIDAGDHVEGRRRIATRSDDIECRKHIGDGLAAL